MSDAQRALSVVPEWKRLLRYWYSRLFNRDQAYYWTKEWQASERASEADYVAGRYMEFDSVEELTGWLTASDDSYPVNPNATEAT